MAQAFSKHLRLTWSKISHAPRFTQITRFPWHVGYWHRRQRFADQVFSEDRHHPPNRNRNHGWNSRDLTIFLRTPVSFLSVFRACSQLLQILKLKTFSSKARGWKDLNIGSISPLNVTRMSIKISHRLRVFENRSMWTLSFGLVPLLVRGAELVNHLRDSEVVWLRSKLPGCAGLSTAMLGSASRFGTVRSLFCARVPALVPGPRCAEGDLTWLRLQNWEIVCNWDLGCNGVLP